MTRKYGYDQRRGNRHERGYTNKWVRASKQYLAEKPWCVMCAAMGVSKPAAEVDHVIPHKGDKRLFWRRSNWQSLCKSHHSSKTRSETSGTPLVLKGATPSGDPIDPHSHWYKGAGEGGYG